MKDKRGVFGLNSVQQFFLILLTIALLAYVIIVVMGTLYDSAVIAHSGLTATVVNESGWINGSTYTLATTTVVGFASPSITSITNTSNFVVIPASNYTLSAAGVLTNTSNIVHDAVKITYTYSYDSNFRINSNTILSNTSGGIASFFVSINPVYAILAVLIIILILVVLVRVVSGGNTTSDSSPQL